MVLPTALTFWPKYIFCAGSFEDWFGQSDARGVWSPSVVFVKSRKRHVKVTHGVEPVLEVIAVYLVVGVAGRAYKLNHVMPIAVTGLPQGRTLPHPGVDPAIIFWRPHKTVDARVDPWLRIKDLAVSLDSAKPLEAVVAPKGHNETAVPEPVRKVGPQAMATCSQPLVSLRQDQPVFCFHSSVKRPRRHVYRSVYTDL